jgi:EAL domain-containing protein (putative c-di-GMP-specific phosphodiesterase class I)
MAVDGERAAELARENEYDVIVSDIAMPGMDGLQLLRTVRESNLDVPVVLITASPALETAVRAMEHGALRYLTKPVDLVALEEVVEYATRLYHIAQLKRQALAHLGTGDRQAGDRAGLEAGFERALRTMWMAYQPIVRCSRREVFGYEALVRLEEPMIPTPGKLFEAAERLGRLPELGRALRANTVESLKQVPIETHLFINLHTHDLGEAAQYWVRSPLAEIAGRVILEVTEHMALDQVKDLAAGVKLLRDAGFRIAIDDLGSGYAGLTSFAQLQPDLVKLDMALVRDVNGEPTKQKLCRSMITLCQEMGMLVVAEGVETAAERDTLVGLGCDLLQGYLFARPERPFPSVVW